MRREMWVENKLHDLSSDMAILLCTYKNLENEKDLDKSWEIEKDLENGPRVYEKEKKGKKSKSENNITMHFCTMIAYMLIVNEIRVFTNMLGMLYKYTYSYIIMMNG